MGVFAVDFHGRARNWWGLLVSNRASFEGRRHGGEGQGAGVVQRVWIGVEMWERGSSRAPKEIEFRCLTESGRDRPSDGWEPCLGTTTFVGLAMNLVGGSV